MHRFVPLAVLALVSAPVAAPVSAQTLNVLVEPLQALVIVQAAVAARNPDAIAAIYTEDARATNPNGASITGRAALRQAWADNFAAGYATVDFTSPKVERRGDRAVMSFSFQAGFQPSGQAPFAIEGRYLIDFARQPQGGWLVAAERWSMAP